MPNLNDYLGSLLSSFSKAKTMSDLQTIQIAKAYDSHDLLKHFSVPRMKIEDVEMTIPIGVESLDQPEYPEFEPFNATKVNSLVYQSILKTTGLSSIPRDISNKLQKEISRNSTALKAEIKETKSNAPLNTFSKNIAKYVSKSIDELTKNTARAQTEKAKESLIKLPEKLEQAILPNISIPSVKEGFEKLNVIVESHKLREIPASNIIQVKVRISEDGMEWDRVENKDGDISTKLIPE